MLTPGACVLLAANGPVEDGGLLDVTVLVTNQSGADALFLLYGQVQADDVALPDSMCQQNNTHWGQCTASVTDLDPSDFYWIWFISG